MAVTNEFHVIMADRLRELADRVERGEVVWIAIDYASGMNPDDPAAKVRVVLPPQRPE